MNIAVTGCLGTGKSTVSKLFSSCLGSQYVDTDQLCRILMEPGGQGFVTFIETFGEGFLNKKGALDRKRLRQAVFSDSSVKEELERILHPIVRDEVASLCLAADSLRANIVVEVPLLYEVGWQDSFDINIVVYVTDEICIERVALRDGLDRGDIQEVLDAQLPIEQKIHKAHFIVDNSGTFVSTFQQVSWVVKDLNRNRLSFF